MTVDWRNDENMDYYVLAGEDGGVNLTCSAHGHVRYYPVGQDLGYIVIDAEQHYRDKHDGPPPPPPPQVDESAITTIEGGRRPRRWPKR